MKFKEGDIVFCYDGGARFKAKIKEITDNGNIVAESKFSNNRYFLHPKQCRRIVKQERRVIWIRKNNSYQEYEIVPPPPKDSTDWIEFVEVKKK